GAPLMNRTSIASIGSFGTAVVASGLALSVALGSLPASAQTPAPAGAEVLDAPSTTSYGVDELRDSFGAAGFSVDQPVAWEWLSPQVTSFQVHEADGSRVVMVLVYPDSTAAD